MLEGRGGSHLLTGHYGITERGRGYTGSNSRAVCGDDDGFGEVKEGVEHRLVVGSDQAVQLPGVHRLDGCTQVDPSAVVGISSS